MRISDWSSDVCSSDLHGRGQLARARELTGAARQHHPAPGYLVEAAELEPRAHQLQRLLHPRLDDADQKGARDLLRVRGVVFADLRHVDQLALVGRRGDRSEEHTSELQSLMRISYAVFCLQKNKITRNKQ